MKRALSIGETILISPDFRLLLENCGYEIAGEIPDGPAAVQLYESMKPDLVIMNTARTEFNWMETLHSIRTMDEKAKIIVIGQKHMVREDIFAEIIAYIVSP